MKTRKNRARRKDVIPALEKERNNVTRTSASPKNATAIWLFSGDRIAARKLREPFRELKFCFAGDEYTALIQALHKLV